MIKAHRFLQTKQTEALHTFLLSGEKLVIIYTKYIKYIK